MYSEKRCPICARVMIVEITKNMDSLYLCPGHPASSQGIK